MKHSALKSIMQWEARSIGTCKAALANTEPNQVGTSAGEAVGPVMRFVLLPDAHAAYRCCPQCVALRSKCATASQINQSDCRAAWTSVAQ